MTMAAWRNRSDRVDSDMENSSDVSPPAFGHQRLAAKRKLQPGLPGGNEVSCTITSVCDPFTVDRPTLTAFDLSRVNTRLTFQQSGRAISHMGVGYAACIWCGVCSGGNRLFGWFTQRS